MARTGGRDAWLLAIANWRALAPTLSFASSPHLWRPASRRWAVDNEVNDHPKLDGVPLGVMDAFELGVPNQPSSVAFHANVSAYVAHLRALTTPLPPTASVCPPESEGDVV